MLEALNTLLRRRRLILAIALAGATGSAAYLLLTSRSWMSTALFMPQARRLPSNLSGIAAQIGIALPASDGGLTPAFYADLIRTSVILTPLASGNYPTADSPGPRPLVDLLKIGNYSANARRTKAETKLGRMIFTSVSQKTGVVTVNIRAKDPVLARALGDRILAEVDSFNQDVRRSQASAERRFTEQRVAQTQSELRAAEDRLQHFLQRNREFRSSPELTFQQDRLQREVNLRQEVYTQLVGALEQAKVDEVRDTPVLTIVQAPHIPALPEPRGLVTGIVVGALLGAFFGAIIALIADGLAGVTAEADASAVSRRLLREFASELRAPWRIFVR